MKTFTETKIWLDELQRIENGSVRAEQIHNELVLIRKSLKAIFDLYATANAPNVKALLCGIATRIWEENMEDKS